MIKISRKIFKMNDLSGLIINWDGVCVSSVEARHLAYCETFRQIGQGNRQWTKADTVAQSGRNPDKIWRDKTLWHENGALAKQVFYAAYMRLLPEYLKLNDNVKTFLTVFKNRCPNVPIVIFGAKTEKVMYHEVNKLLPNELVDKIYGSRSGSINNKDMSNPTSIKSILDSFNLPANAHTLYLGYKKSDEALARSVGIAYQNGQSFMLDYLSNNLGKSIVKADVMPFVYSFEHTKE